MSARQSLVRASRIALAVSLSLFALVPTTNAAVGSTSYEVYALHGAEVWFTPTTGTFVGIGNGDAGDLSGWYTAVDHSLVISPSGAITGGTASLVRVDGVRMTGYFDGGTVIQTGFGDSCTQESHQVAGTLTGVTRTDRPGATGVAYFSATLTHYRTWFLGKCYSYSASVEGTFSILI
jgi:hypothetical protein